MSEPWSLPHSWAWASAEDIAMIVGGGTPDTQRPDYFGGDISWLTPADLSGYTAKHITTGARTLTGTGYQHSGAQLMPKGAVVFSSRAPIGYVAIASNPICTNQGFKSFVPESGIQSDYLYYYLQRAKPLALTLASGTTFLEVSGRKIATLPVPIPPLAEQRRIAETLDELLSDLDAGIATLERVRAKLKHYRAAVLKAAVDGALTAEWRRQHPATETADALLTRILAERRRRWEEAQLLKFEAAGKSPPNGWERKYRTPKKPDGTVGANLPASWAWTGFDELSDGRAHSLKAGPFGSALKKEFYTESGFKIYGQEQVIRGDPFFGAYFIDKERFAKLKSCEVKPGDVLISLVGTTGKVLLLPDGIAPGIINPRLLKLTLLPGGVEPRFIKLVLESPQARAFFKASAHGGTMDVLNLSILKEFRIPLPPLAEQGVIIEAVDDQLSVIDHVDRELNTRLKTSQALRQSILRHAFTGQLARQDPNDEPASELLKRVAAERKERARLARVAKPTKPKTKTPRRRATQE